MQNLSFLYLALSSDRIVDITEKALPVLENLLQLVLGVGAVVGAWYAKRSADRNNKSIQKTQSLVQDNTNITIYSQDQLIKLEGYITKVQNKHAKELSEANRRIQALSDEVAILRRQLDDDASELPTKVDI